MPTRSWTRKPRPPSSPGRNLSPRPRAIGSPGGRNISAGGFSTRVGIRTTNSASLTGAGETTAPGNLTQTGGLFVLDGAYPVIGDGFGVKYTFEEPNGDRFSMWGTNDMNQVIRLPYHKGHFIKMTFVGNDTNSKAGQSARKVIEVRASREVVADIPLIDLAEAGDQPF